MGYLDNDNTYGYGPENYVVYSGLDSAKDAVLGEYSAKVFFGYAEKDTKWTLTARVDNNVVWVKEGEMESTYNEGESNSFDDDFDPSKFESEVFTIVLDSYANLEC